MSMTVAMKFTLGAAGVGLVGGAVAERLLSPGSIQNSEAGSEWNKLHENFLAEHPTPRGTHVLVNSEPPWKNAALLGGGGVALGALGGGLMFAASKMQPQVYPLFVGGLAAAALGATFVIGAGSSWALRGSFD